MPPVFHLPPDKPVVRWREGDRSFCHRFDSASIDAVNAALGAERPLLVRGEPGTGKTQLARAVAAHLDWQFLATVIDSRTEARDMLWSFDAVARLAKAQLLAALPREKSATLDFERELAEADFVRPGPLWWAFDWDGCAKREGSLGRRVPAINGDPKRGSILLIDEIDKADSDVPNGLLEALGAHAFEPLAHEPVRPKHRPPLVILTTNEERALPDAFVRRCAVLVLPFPSESDLRQRAADHFPKAEGLIEEAVSALMEDRAAIRTDGEPKPGQAELFDLLRAVISMASRPKEQLELLGKLRKYTLGKYSP